jgi:hypothetical protein
MVEIIELNVAFGELGLLLLFIKYVTDIFFEMQLSGIALISLSASSLVQRQEFKKGSDDKQKYLAEDDKYMVTLMNIVVAIAVSVLLIFLSLFGLRGAFGEKKCLISCVSSCLY